MKKTKVMATIGPSSKDEIILEEMILNGMNIARLNMKYSSIEFCADIVDKIRNIDKKLKTNTAILLDLKGPDIKVGKFTGGKAYLRDNDKIRIHMDPIIGDSTKFSVSYSNLINDVKTNTVFKLDNGLIEIKVLEKSENSLLCEVIKGGFVEDNKSLRVIDTTINMPFITSEDKSAIIFAGRENIDYIALSFVSSAEDILSVNDLLIEYGNDHASIISKIEKEKALEDLDEIIRVSDGIMISRKDLGVEIPIERIPSIQRSIINKCHLQSKVSIVATEMLSTLENEVKPSGSEISDIANAIVDGVDAIMLTGETTIGKYPVGTISMMNKIIKTSELDINYIELSTKAMRTENQDITGSIAYSVVGCATRLKCIAIVTPTMSGYTAKKISRFRPNCPIVALTPNIETARSLNLYYGIYPVLIEDTKSFDMILKLSKNSVIKKFNYQEGDKIIITGGYPFKEVKHTNFMKIEEL
ncbi:MAG: pyruvate kinase [Lactobacillales bacterium]|nr:pyruvate kinase [Lactobacillales bacterium]